MNSCKFLTKRLYYFKAIYCNIAGCNLLCIFGHPVATCCNMLGIVSSSLKMVKFEPKTPNMLQHIATGWPNACNIWHPIMQCNFFQASISQLIKLCLYMYIQVTTMIYQGFIFLCNSNMYYLSYIHLKCCSHLAGA